MLCTSFVQLSSKPFAFVSTLVFFFVGELKFLRRSEHNFGQTVVLRKLHFLHSLLSSNSLRVHSYQFVDDSRFSKNTARKASVDKTAVRTLAISQSASVNFSFHPTHFLISSLSLSFFNCVRVPLRETPSVRFSIYPELLLQQQLLRSGNEKLFRSRECSCLSLSCQLASFPL